ncbi:GNAT family N-acetyltransferase [Dyadobacter helix]|nr:GNAT family N-acetyltransferase [Dyadobacter sp. CECT 9275]
MENQLNWTLKTFEELSNEELYQLLRLRSEVFVVEQNCNFLDMDNKDQQCHHLLGWDCGELMAVARIVPPGISYEFPSIGRIVVSPRGRGRKYGVELVHKAIQCVDNFYGKGNIRIGAQLYLKKFYETFHFRQSGSIYLEDNIEHIEMTRVFNE